MIFKIAYINIFNCCSHNNLKYNMIKVKKLQKKVYNLIITFFISLFLTFNLYKRIKQFIKLALAYEKV